jgi:ABC-type branched-subunit amino acid transport system substrate-binding protein
MSKLIAALAMVISSAFLVAACGGDDDSSSGGGGDAGSGGTIKMGANYEESGPGSLYGVSKLIGVQVGAEVINEAGGIEVGGESYDVEIMPCDNRSEATYGVQCAQQAADEDVLWTAAPDLGFEGAYEIFKENNILTVGNGGGASDLLTNEIDDNPLLTFEFLTYQENVESHLMQIKELYPDVKKVATLLPNDANGQVQDQAFRDLAPEYGIEITGQELHPTDASGDFTSFLTNLKSGNPDLIHLGYYPAVAAAAVEQGADLDAAPIFSAEGLTFNDLKGSNFDGYTLHAFQTGYSWFPGFMPEDKQWLEMIDRFDEVADGRAYLPAIIINGMIGDLMIIKEAIEAADSLEPEEIVAAFEGVEYDGPFGPATGTATRATDQARTPFAIDDDGNVKAWVFPTGLTEKPTEEVDVGPRSKVESELKPVDG